MAGAQDSTPAAGTALSGGRGGRRRRWLRRLLLTLAGVGAGLVLVAIIAWWQRLPLARVVLHQGFEKLAAEGLHLGGDIVAIDWQRGVVFDTLILYDDPQHTMQVASLSGLEVRPTRSGGWGARLQFHDSEVLLYTAAAQRRIEPLRGSVEINGEGVRVEFLLARAGAVNLSLRDIDYRFPRGAGRDPGKPHEPRDGRDGQRLAQVPELVENAWQWLNWEVAAGGEFRVEIDSLRVAAGAVQSIRAEASIRDARLESKGIEVPELRLDSREWTAEGLEATLGGRDLRFDRFGAAGGFRGTLRSDGRGWEASLDLDRFEARTASALLGLDRAEVAARGKGGRLEGEVATAGGDLDGERLPGLVADLRRDGRLLDLRIDTPATSGQLPVSLAGAGTAAAVGATAALAAAPGAAAAGEDRAAPGPAGEELEPVEAERVESDEAAPEPGSDGAEAAAARLAGTGGDSAAPAGSDAAARVEAAEAAARPGDPGAVVDQLAVAPGLPPILQVALRWDGDRKQLEVPQGFSSLDLWRLAEVVLDGQKVFAELESIGVPALRFEGIHGDFSGAEPRLRGVVRIERPAALRWIERDLEFAFSGGRYEIDGSSVAIDQFAGRAFDGPVTASGTLDWSRSDQLLLRLHQVELEPDLARVTSAFGLRLFRVDLAGRPRISAETVAVPLRRPSGCTVEGFSIEGEALVAYGGPPQAGAAPRVRLDHSARDSALRGLELARTDALEAEAVGGTPRPSVIDQRLEAVITFAQGDYESGRVRLDSLIVRAFEAEHTLDDAEVDWSGDNRGLRIGAAMAHGLDLGELGAYLDSTQRWGLALSGTADTLVSNLNLPFADAAQTRLDGFRITGDATVGKRLGEGERGFDLRLGLGEVSGVYAPGGVDIASASGSLFDGALTLGNARVRWAGEVRGASVERIEASPDLEQVGALLRLEARGIRPGGSPRLSVEQFQLDFSDPRRFDLASFAVDGEARLGLRAGGRWLPIGIRSARGRYDPGSVELDTVAGSLFEGGWQASDVRASWGEETRWDLPNLSIDDLVLGSVAEWLGQEREGRLQGGLQTRIRASGGSSLRSVSANARVVVSDGAFYSLPVLGPLHFLLKRLVPALPEDVAKDASADLILAAGVLRTDNLTIESSASRIELAGRYDLNQQQVEADASVRLRGIVGIATFLLSEALTVHGEGPPNDVRYRFTYLPLPGIGQLHQLQQLPQDFLQMPGVRELPELQRLPVVGEILGTVNDVRELPLLRQIPLLGRSREDEAADAGEGNREGLIDRLNPFHRSPEPAPQETEQVPQEGQARPPAEDAKEDGGGARRGLRRLLPF